MDINNLIFRAAESVDELDLLLKLKYDQYRIGKQYAFFSDNKYGIDMEQWDRYSVHYGLFDIAKNKVAAYLRVVFDELSHQSEWIPKLVSKYDEVFFSRALTNPTVPFPVLSYYPEAIKILKPLLEEATSLNKKISSVSRLTIHEDYRSPRVVSAITDHIFYKYANTVYACIITCLPTHKAYYTSRGFEVLDGPQIVSNQSSSDTKKFSNTQSLLLLLLLQNYKKNHLKGLEIFQMNT